MEGGRGLERGVDGTPSRLPDRDGRRRARSRIATARAANRSSTSRGEWYPLDEAIGDAATTSFVFNCYDAPNGSTSEGRIDDGPWQPMPPHAMASKPTPDLTMVHHFVLTADTSKLASGEHTLSARVTWPDGTIVEESKRFTIQPKP